MGNSVRRTSTLLPRDPSRFPCAENGWRYEWTTESDDPPPRPIAPASRFPDFMKNAGPERRMNDREVRWGLTKRTIDDRIPRLIWRMKASHDGTTRAVLAAFSLVHALGQYSTDVEFLGAVSEIAVPADKPGRMKIDAFKDAIPSRMTEIPVSMAHRIVLEVEDLWRRHKFSDHYMEKLKPVIEEYAEVPMTTRSGDIPLFDVLKRIYAATEP